MAWTPGLRNASAHAWTATRVTSTGPEVATRSTVSTATRTASAGVGAAPSSSRSSNRATVWLSTRSTIAAISSSLLAKYRYTAPADSPDAAMMSAMPVAWNPFSANRVNAASRICSRRAVR